MKKQNTTPTRLASTALACVLVAALSLTGTGAEAIDQKTVSANLEDSFEMDYVWWVNGDDSSDPDWHDFGYYNGSSRSSYYPGGGLASEEPQDTIGIFAPSELWANAGAVSPPPPPVHYAYSIGCDFGGISWWNTWVQNRLDLGGDLTPSILYAADTYGPLGYQSYYNLKPTVGYLRGQNPAGADRLGSEVVYLNGHASYDNLLCGDYEYASLFGNVPTGSDYMCGVWCYSDGQSSTSLYNYAGLSGRDLSGTKLISFVGCNTAGFLEGDGAGDHHFDDNLCEVALDCGAQAAMGFTGTIDGLTPAGLYWKQKYNDALAFGYTVDNARLYANERAVDYAEEHGEATPVNLVEYAIVLGDTTVTIAPV
jgi:hypothetical protein